MDKRRSKAEETEVRPNKTCKEMEDVIFIDDKKTKNNEQIISDEDETAETADERDEEEDDDDEDLVTGNEEDVYAAEKLLKQRILKGKIEYLVKWKDWSNEHNSWEPVDNILDKRLIEEFDQRRSKVGRKSKSLSGNNSSLNNISINSTSSPFNATNHKKEINNKSKQSRLNRKAMESNVTSNKLSKVDSHTPIIKQTNVTKVVENKSVDESIPESSANGDCKHSSEEEVIIYDETLKEKQSKQLEIPSNNNKNRPIGIKPTEKRPLVETNLVSTGSSESNNLASESAKKARIELKGVTPQSVPIEQLQKIDQSNPKTSQLPTLSVSVRQPETLQQNDNVQPSHQSKTQNSTQPLMSRRDELKKITKESPGAYSLARLKEDREAKQQRLAVQQSSTIQQQSFQSISSPAVTNIVSSSSSSSVTSTLSTIEGKENNLTRGNSLNANSKSNPITILSASFVSAPTSPVPITSSITSNQTARTENSNEIISSLDRHQPEAKDLNILEKNKRVSEANRLNQPISVSSQSQQIKIGGSNSVTITRADQRSKEIISSSSLNTQVTTVSSIVSSLSSLAPPSSSISSPAVGICSATFVNNPESIVRAPINLLNSHNFLQLAKAVGSRSSPTTINLTSGSPQSISSSSQQHSHHQQQMIVAVPSSVSQQNGKTISTTVRSSPMINNPPIKSVASPMFHANASSSITPVFISNGQIYPNNLITGNSHILPLPPATISNSSGLSCVRDSNLLTRTATGVNKNIVEISVQSSTGSMKNTPSIVKLTDKGDKKIQISANIRQNLQQFTKQPSPQQFQQQSIFRIPVQPAQQQSHQSQQLQPLLMTASPIAPSDPLGKRFQNTSNAILSAQQKSIKRCSPPPDFLRKQQLADQVIVTDVSENNVMITIRECKSQEMFFRRTNNGPKRKKRIKQRLACAEST